MSRKVLYALIAVSAWLLGVCWAIASPVGSSPDDDFHLVSIYCSAADDALCRDLDGEGPGTEVEVESQLRGQTCYAFNSEQSAECTQALADGELVVTDRYNHTGEYPGTYYRVMSLFASEDVPAAVLTMRVVTLTVVLLAFALAVVASPLLRDSQLIAWSVASVPLGIFLFASTNPSAWATAGVAAMWPAGFALVHASNGRQLALAGAAALVAGVLATARSDTAGMAAGVLGLVLIAYARSRAQLRAGLVIVALIVVLGLVFLASGGTGAVSSDTSEPKRALWSNIVNLPHLFMGVFGVDRGLGWLDTAMPGLVWVPMVGAAAALMVIGIGVLRLPRGIVLAGVLFAAALYPLATLYLSGAGPVVWFQPRYVLPLLLALVGVALSPEQGFAWRLSNPQRWTLTVCVAVAAAVAFHVNLRRYVTGTDAMSLNLNDGSEWSYFTSLSPMVLWLLASVAGAVLFSSVLALVRAPRETSLLPGTPRNG